MAHLDTLANAATITSEHTWTSTKGEKTFRLTHADPTCARLAEGTVVETTVGVTEWPCATCIAVDEPRLDGPAREEGPSDIYGAAGPGTGHSEVRPPTEKALALLTALVRGTAFAALTALWNEPTLLVSGDLLGASRARQIGSVSPLDPADPASFAAAVEAFVPGEVASLVGTPPSAVRCSQALDDFKAGDVRPLWRPIVASNFQTAASAPQTTPATPQAGVRANRYAGTCAACGGDVAEAEGRLSKSEAGAWIVLHLEGQCDEAGAEPRPWLERGSVHVIDDAFVRVHIGQQSGFPYAVQVEVIEPAEWRDEADGTRTLVRPGVIKWHRTPGLTKRLAADTIATPEQAAAFGELVGRCCFCSTPIDTPESTTAGYGPKCAAKYGLPWG